MPRPKKIKAQVEDFEAFVDLVKGDKPQIALLEFADVSTLKDKLNEVIKHLNS